MTERMIPTHGAELCTEAFGQPHQPALLLIMGACASMLWWPQEFCERLAQAGYFVIRFDHRDTGRSTCYEPGTIHYSLDDMMEDAVAILDGYGVKSATVAGASLGGMIAQLMALKHPDRVERLVLLISGPVAVPEGIVLPPIGQKVLDHHANSGSMDWSNEALALDFMVAGWRITAGTRHPFDESLIRATAVEDYHRSTNLRSSFNHALLSGGEWASGQLPSIQAPTLVVQGTDDPVLPFPHAEYLARVIPKARLVALKGAGHELHRGDWDQIIAEIKALH
ncbi:alpha/beta fold hydrolase [Oligoflexus tunisiensis]|uniref:alpha/beta fold hydrolase n=1 Tax=Oligoflexus tunisiensis TaxID=708132 RepID=UPI00114CA58A|nr:alpha/beta fold hydrolase [Oligoflexus tunisiensis]